MDIFSIRPGLVAAVASPNTPLALSLDGWEGVSIFKSVITAFTLRMASGVQFSHNLLDFIDVYTFGERISEFAVSGVAFHGFCPVEDYDDAGNFLPTYHGFEYVLEYYNTYRASSYGAPVVAAIGLGTVLEGYLTNATIGVSNAETKLAQFDLNFKTIPQVSILD